MLSAAQSYLSLRRNINSLYQHHRLDQVIHHALSVIEKDLRRAGYCNGNKCQGKSVTTNPDGSCIIVAYDLNHNDEWEKTGESEGTDYFGYRLEKDILERSRNSIDCKDGLWNALLDPEEIVVSHFLIKQRKAGTGKSLFALQLAAHWKKHPKVQKQINLVFSGYNA